MAQADSAPQSDSPTLRWIPEGISPERIYRVWFVNIKDGAETHQSVSGFLKLVEDRPGDKNPGIMLARIDNTSIYFPPGQWLRIQEQDPRDNGQTRRLD